jgi:hypothetical protein
MAIDIKNLVQIIQKKEHAVTSSTSVQDMIDIMKAAQKAEGSLIRNYDSAGDLPDAATTTERIAYLSDTRTLRFNNGTWDNPLLGAAPADTGEFYQGTISGYTSGGSSSNIIDKYPFSADGDATDVGDLTLTTKSAGAGQSSSTYGYHSGGVTPTTTNVIDKWSFTVDENATDVGDLTQIKYAQMGQSSEVSGYNSGGFSPPNINVIDKFPFSVDANATDVGDLTDPRYYASGQNSTTSGYTSGGRNPTYVNIIDKFPFATDANATDVGNITLAKIGMAGQSSDISGYISAGREPLNIALNVIEKFSFTSDGNSSDVGDLTIGGRYSSGQSSNVSGYTSGRLDPASPGSPLDTIDKFPFSTDENATDVGNITAGRSFPAGNQV